MSITVKNHIDQIKEKIKLYDEANETLKKLEDIIKRLDKSSKSNNALANTSAANSISKWHSECVEFIEKHITESSYSENITSKLERAMEIVYKIDGFMTGVSDIMTNSIFDPFMLVSDTFREIKTATTHIIDKHNKFPYSCQCIDDLVKLTLMIDSDRYEVDWKNLFSGWKSICKVEINIINEYIDSIVIDDVPDKYRK